MGYTEDDVRWAYQYYLGRPPESADAIATHARAKDLRNSMYMSPERLARGASYYRPDEYCCWRPGRPRIVVLSSCQGPPLARVIAAIADVSVFGCAISKTKDKHLAAHLMAMMEAADFVLSAPLTDSWQPFDEQNLRERLGSRLLTYNRPNFAALHPDLVYLRGPEPRSPVGDYHSRIVVDSFLAGMTEEQCTARFNKQEYVRMGFEDIAQKAISKLRKNDTSVDVKIADFVLENMKDREILYTSNHPTQILNSHIAKEFIGKIGIEQIPARPVMIPTVLSSNVIWPIDRDWAEIMDLSFHTESVFWHSNYMIPLEEFVIRSYALYRRSDPEKLKIRE
ncbi:WcbI family polysaccharide biosynthesis putative acetyltransferase [Pseudochelatococcus sp. B33]